ncbi:metallophosphoesterase [Runella sp. MFBS21]|uniref:metallophosphoesterase n=1 Tax=Runella sp. MFBS21 TaxID=3034018 RepID=UPI0023F62DA6|nr:metallophosphoesterase [Runella sp. MFBS21]MDF7817938.1 metallophosphoesterase [Runella sp. MFBS21]
MNDIIVHISDLHISDHYGIGRNNKNTFLKAESKNEENHAFINSLVHKIKEIQHRHIYLIVTGDISDCGESCEFEIATELMNKLITDLNIKGTLQIPGDHDIHRDSIKNVLRETRKRSESPFSESTLQNISHDITKAKFKNFNTFYKSIKNEDFNSDKIIFDSLVTENIVFLGINSNHEINQDGGKGFINTIQFENELQIIKETYPGLEIVLCMHHNLHGDYENTQSGQWDVDNRRLLISDFQKQGVKCILSGNEHTPNSKSLSISEIIISDSGSISSVSNPPGSFKIYEIIKNEKGIYLKNNLYTLVSTGSANALKFGNWTTINISETKGAEKDSFILKDLPTPVSPSSIQDLPHSNDIIEINQEISNIEIQRKVYSNPIIQEKLYQIIKERKLFHQGHFHCSETSRTHNWIDTARLLEKEEDLFFIKNAIIDIISTFNLSFNCNLIIGLGYEGNIIASKAAIKYNIPYTFLPYDYRYKDHHEFENNINFDNSEYKYKKAMIITDVVNTGSTIINLIKEKERTFFENTEEITIISLFYTGQDELNHDILNHKINDITTMYPPKKIELYSIKVIKIERCPYGADYKNTCFIYRDQLNPVYKFYTEEE